MRCIRCRVADQFPPSLGVQNRQDSCDDDSARLGWVVLEAIVENFDGSAFSDKEVAGRYYGIALIGTVSSYVSNPAPELALRHFIRVMFLPPCIMSAFRIDPPSGRHPN